MARLGQRAFARYMGVTLQAVQKAIKTGRITLEADGTIKAEEAKAAWRNNTDESRKSLADLARSNGATDPDDIDGPEGPDLLDPADPSDGGGFAAGAPKDDPSLTQYRATRAAREHTRHQRELIELEKLKGSLIDVSEAQRIGYTAFRTLRDAVLNVPVRVKDSLAAELDPSSVERMLEEELTIALASIDFAKMMKDQDADDADGSDREFSTDASGRDPAG